MFADPITGLLGAVYFCAKAEETKSTDASVATTLVRHKGENLSLLIGELLQGGFFRPSGKLRKGNFSKSRVSSGEALPAGVFAN